ncbi:MAG: hypothetical protein U9R01_01880 [candidate division WOR-3 bacterium]|nr:hypothetical protein [candidate division WOR-3 bacterium]
MREFLVKLGKIDRRVIYLLAILAVVIPLVVKIRLPMYVSRETKGVYTTIEHCAEDKIVLVDCSWDAGNRGENWPQTEAIMEHLMRKGIKFAIMSIIPQGAGFGREVAEKVAKKYGKEYGVDWCSFGYLAAGGRAGAAVIQALAKDIEGVVKKDIKGTPLDSIPMMKGIEDIHDISLICGIAYWPTEDWLRFVQGVYGTNTVFCSSAIVSSSLYPYLDSGQLCGLLVGVRGAAEYEHLLGTEELGTELIIPQSMVHLLIVVLIILANIGFWAERREKKEER